MKEVCEMSCYKLTYEDERYAAGKAQGLAEARKENETRGSVKLLLRQIKGGRNDVPSAGHGRKFCVSVFRQRSRMVL